MAARSEERGQHHQLRCRQPLASSCHPPQFLAASLKLAACHRHPPTRSARDQSPCSLSMARISSAWFAAAARPDAVRRTFGTCIRMTCCLFPRAFVTASPTLRPAKPSKSELRPRLLLCAEAMMCRCLLPRLMLVSSGRTFQPCGKLWGRTATCRDLI